MANKQVGEMEFELCGETILLRPSHQALAEIEDKAGRGIWLIQNALSKMDIRIKDIAAIIYAGMLGANENKVPKYTFEQVKQKVFENGFSKSSTVAVEFFMNAIKGRQDIPLEGENGEQAEEGKEKTPTGK